MKIENKQKKENIDFNINLDSIPDSRKIYINSESAFYYEPNIENLYTHADLVVLASFLQIDKMVVDIDRINTLSKFKIDKILKNNLSDNIENNLDIKILGGTMKLSEYLEKGENVTSSFSNIKEEDKNQYYVIQRVPDLSLAKDKKYILFLNLRNNELNLNSLYYGIREIQDNKIYDYNTKQFIESNLNLEN